MKRKDLRYGFIMILMACTFALLVSCGPGGGADSGEDLSTASIKLSADPDTVPADGRSSAAITANLETSSGAAVAKDTTVTFSTTLGSFRDQSTSYTVSTPDDSGSVLVSLIAGLLPGKAEITATSNQVTQNASMEFTGAPGVPNRISLATSQISVKSDNSDSATITATVLDGKNAVVEEGLMVAFSTDSGQLSASSVETDANGQAQVTFSSGTLDPKNGIATITATVSGIAPAQIPIQILGSTLTLSTDHSTITTGGSRKAVLTVLAKDAGGNPVYNTPITLRATGTGRAVLSPNRGNTDTRGELKVTVTGTRAGEVTVTAEGLGETATQDYTVSPAGAGFFHISKPSDDLMHLHIGETLTITVTAPAPTTSVVFVATFGNWDGGASAVITKDVSGGQASAVFSSGLAGVASVQVYDENKPALSDSCELVVTAPVKDAANITLQSNTYIVPQSVGDNTYTATLTATVRTSSASGRQPVKDAAIALSIKNQTGGGETVYPAIVFTDDSGVATTTFTSGSLSSGAEGVMVIATVLGQGATGQLTTISFNDSNPATITRSDSGSFVTDDFEAGEQIKVEGSASNDGNYVIAGVTADTLTLETGETLTDEAAGKKVTITAVTTSTNIVIGGTAGSLVIGRGSKIEVLSPTTYSLPMSVLVADSNGNPMPGAAVSISAWPDYYSTGYWMHRVEETMDPTTGIITTKVLDECYAEITGTYPNEDLNENLFLDPGEDVGSDPGHGDGQLTPPNSAAGTVPMIVTTDENGVANFDLIYMKSSAFWITDRIRASTLVLGTEMTSTMPFRLPAERAEAEACELPSSPYNAKREVEFINLEPKNPNLTADGSSTIIIQAEVKDVNLNPVEGEIITFDVTAGTGTLSTPMAITNIEGRAEVKYTASTTAGKETVTATTSNGITSDRPVTITLIDAIVGEVSVTKGCEKIVADGISRVQILATVLDTDKKFVLNNTLVSFTTTAGYITNVAPTINGVAQATLTSSTNVGKAKITVWAGGVCGKESVDFIPGPVTKILLTATPPNLTADGSSESTIRAFVTDVYGNAVEDETISFTLISNKDNDIGTLAAPTDTTIGGVATVIYTAATTPGSETVRAEATNGVHNTVPIVLIDPIVKRIECQVGCEDIIAGGVDCDNIPVTDDDPVLVHALVYDLNGNFVPNGTSVCFTTTAGTFVGAPPPPGTAYVVETINGEATAMLQSTICVGTANITIWAGGVCCKETVDFIPGPVHTISLTAIPPNVTADGSSKSTIRAFVTDVYGNAIEDELISFFVTGTGTLSAPTAPTIGGVATVTYTASTVVGTTDTIRAHSTNCTTSDPVDPVHITLIEPIVKKIECSLGCEDIIAGGVDCDHIPVGTVDPVLVHALVYDVNGNFVPDYTKVTFTTTAGTFIDTDPPGICYVAETINGEATARLMSSTHVGTAKITIWAGGVCCKESVEFIPGPPSPTTILLTAKPNKLPADGSSTSTIRAFVTDAHGNAVEGETISFFISSETGKLSAPTATTSGGEAIVIYTAATTPDTDETVTAVATNGTPSQEPVTIELIEPIVGDVTVTAGCDPLIANGTSCALITATVLDPNGNNVPDGTTVTFTTTAGTVLPETTTINGVATTTLTSSSNVGTATITATADCVCGSTDVEFIAAAPFSVSVSAKPANLTADGTSESTITVMVLDAKGNPVDEGGETITISADYGTFENGGKTITATTSAGVATVTYTAPSAVPPTGYDTITAETTNEQPGSTPINLIGPQIAGIELEPIPPSLPADGSSKARISATLTLIGGGEAPDGTTVNFSIKEGEGHGSITPTATTAGGVAIATLTSGNTTEIVHIQAEAGGIIVEIPMKYTPGSVTLTIAPNSLLGTGKETAEVTATVEDVHENRVPGVKVSFTLDDLSLGTLSSDTATTNLEDYLPEDHLPEAHLQKGQAQVTFQEAAQGGTITVTATWDTTPSAPGGEVTGSETIDIQPPPAFIEIADGSPDPTSINIKGTGGKSTSRITFDVKDNQGNPVADGYRIDFYIDSGPNGGENIVPLSARTQNGQVSTILYSGFKSGPVSIRATYYHNSNVSTTTSQITILAGPPVGEEFGVFAGYLNISGLWMANLIDPISISAADIYGNAIPDNTAISFKTYNTGGFFESGAATTTGGVATDNLHSAGTYLQPLQGFVSVTAEAINGGRTTHVTSLAVTPSPDNRIIYAGTDGGGVYKSTNSGATWVNISRSTENPKVGQNWMNPHIKGNSAICVDPDDHNVVYVGTGYLGRGNVYRSLDGGMNWNSNNIEEWNGILSTGEAVLTVLCDDGGSDYVWIGTEGLGALYAPDGEDFMWGGTVTTPVLDTTASGSGADGTMSQVVLSLTSKNETWTATYRQVDTTPPVLDTTASGSNADGTMTGLSATSTAENETWTIEYTGGYNNDVVGSHGTLTVVSTSASTLTENWVITCIDGTVGSEVFSVESSVTGFHANITDITQNYTSDYGEVTFFITGTNFEDGSGVPPADTFMFSTTVDGWSVASSVSPGPHLNAKTDAPFTSLNNEVSFTINPGATQFYQQGDTWTFFTFFISNWVVEGSVSGTQCRRAQNNQEYTSDNHEVTFTIYEVTTPFAQADNFTFDVSIESRLGYGKTVRDIVRVPGTNGITAVLYAATNTGVFTSTDGGQNWTETGSFTGDFITTLALHPTPTNVIYAGTEDAGVWVSADSGVSWNQSPSGMGDGLSATTSVPGPDNEGNGVMSEVTVGLETESEYWSVTCDAAAEATTPVANSGNTGQGTMGAMSVAPANTETQIWSITCDAAAEATAPVPGAGNTGNGVMGAVSVAPANTMTEDWSVTCDAVAEATTPVPGPGNTGQGVMGAVSVDPANTKTEDWSVTCITAAADGGVFSVTGTVSGAQAADATVGIVYTSDGGEVSFTISDGAPDFIVGDSFTFSTSATAFSVDGSVAGLQTNQAYLYEPYTSDAGEVSFAISDGSNNFVVGDSFTFSTSATTFNVSGSVSGLQINKAYLYEPYTSDGGEVSFTISDGDPDFVVGDSFTFCTSAMFSVSGSVSGLQTNQANLCKPYTSDNSEVTFTISEGSIDFQVGDTFTFSTTRDPGRTIKDLLVDSAHNKLYAITYFWGASEPHAVGNVYVIDLDVSGVPTGDWSEANTGLPQYDPPDDTTLFAQHVMAFDEDHLSVPSVPSLYIGGEGINLCKATSGLDADPPDPVWQDSKSGLTNLIMARMPILFSGVCAMDITVDTTFYPVVHYTVYIQDKNGNPPIEGSTFVAKYTPESGDAIILTNVTYPDCYTHTGTFSDPADTTTNNPYTFSVTVEPDSKVEFTFTPTCLEEAPGCSGSASIETFRY